MRRNLQEPLALTQALGYQAEFVVFEVAQTPMNQLAAPLRRGPGEIAHFSQAHGEAAPRCVARDARAVDAAADYKKVKAVHARIFANPDGKIAGYVGNS